MGEFRIGLRVLTSSMFGVGLGISGLLTYNSGLFADSLARDFGLSRTAYGAALFGSTVALALAMPLVGRSVDRFGPRLTAAAGALALVLGFVALSRVRSVAAYVAVMGLLGFFAASSGPVPFTRAVATSFERSRGLALGLTQMGIGLAAALIPPTIAHQIAQHGWRSGFLVLAVLAALGLVPVLLGLPGRDERETDTATRPDFAAIRTSRTYRVQLVAFSTMALAFAGMLAHFVPMLRDAGISVERAGILAGLIGISVILTRVIVGWLADRVEPAFLAAASCLLCGAGCVILAVGGPPLAPLGAIAFGLAMGAEADLIGILTARNFPLAAYGRAYASQYAFFMISAGLSPLWVGYLADVTGDYRSSLWICAGALLGPSVLFLRLPKLAMAEFNRA